LLLGAPASSLAQPRWYKGNTHTHTLNSDGDSTPDEVVRWYREHGYHFLVLSDHNFLTKVDGLNAVHGAEEKFLLIRGEEVTDRFGEKPIHVNGLHIEKLVAPQGGTSVADVVQRNVDAIRAANGVPHINHPNYGWAISPDDLKKIERDRLFEIFNGHPLVNNAGGGGYPSLEEVWDILLSGGKLLYGIAVDDAHHFKRPYDPDASRPGRGWVVVRAEKLTAEAILAAMERGDFYASTGVEIEDYAANSETMTIRMREKSLTKFRTTFIGRGGSVLATVTSNPATYTIRGDEGYVRARVTDSNGHTAWLQPMVIRR
ncbi:MAG TPA: CehA/McbA family metallohydrolase, partial [Thermoanaerobaculia bacterium]|nr:CehA/McbA family metallohydrolase [Thermoanaerobaculia bacterium]